MYDKYFPQLLEGEASWIELPVQWRDRHHGQASGPHQLLVAVFEGALHDLALYAKTPTVRSRSLYEAVQRWLWTEEHPPTVSFSFPFLAHHLGAEPDALRTAILRRYPPLPHLTTRIIKRINNTNK